MVSLLSDKYYLKVGRAADLKSPRERLAYRLLEIFPGMLIWLTFLAIILFSWIKPLWASLFVTIFCVYWLLRVVHFVFHLISAYRQMQINLKTDWIKKNQEVKNKNWRDIYHLVIFPTYKEDIEVMRHSFSALLNSRYPKDRMTVVLAIEERAGEADLKMAETISQEFKDKFYRFLVTCHPKNLPGEISGKGSNETWAARIAKEKIIDPESIPYENIVVSSLDADTQVFPDYFACLTYNHLTVPYPQRSSYQPIPLYLNNLWQSPFFSRVVSACNVFWQMMQQQRPEKIVTYSSHSMSFKALVEMDFWQTNVVSEDAGIFWKSFLFYDGDYRIVPLHYPVSMDSCAVGGFKKTVINQYKQQRRWAWGSEGIPYLIFGLWKNKKIPLKQKVHYPFLIIEGFWAWATNVLILLILGRLPGILGGQEFQSSVISYNLPQITGNLMTLALIGVLACVIVNSLLLTPRPSNVSRWKSLSMLVQWALFPFILIIFGALPAIDAQTRLMLGKYMNFWPTEKGRFLKEDPFKAVFWKKAGNKL
ncbi:MAG: glycosyltransferase family 2 protein [bacterium]|nr:glycosyltransferase family 2 protein [bacterium]